MPTFAWYDRTESDSKYAYINKHLFTYARVVIKSQLKK